MSTVRNRAARAEKRRETASSPAGMVFDYASLAQAENIPAATLRSLESEAAHEFPNDLMLMELHMLRAIKARGKKRYMAKT